MDALFNISYGLYIVTVKDEKYNGCIINTLQQITSNPIQISITINKDNLTTQIIEKTGIFNVSILDTTTTFDTIQTFGFQSGKTVDKFANFTDFNIAQNGLPYISKQTNAYICAKVISSIDVGTHITFVAEILNSEILSKEKSLTYAYYTEKIKPQTTAKNKYVCSICGYVYEGENLPKDYVCPLCKHGSEVFELQK